MNPNVQPAIVFFFFFLFFFKSTLTKGIYDEYMTPHHIQNPFSQMLNDSLKSREHTALRVALL